jgi:8-oxo-dGTP pyrophosphatase MutT (NUDIX family)
MCPTDKPISEPRGSSTVVLVRETEASPEILLVLRHAKSAFGASYVFPGGVLEPADELTGTNGDMDDTAATKVLDLQCGGGAYFSAAVRELFEEVGVLLARASGGKWADPCLYTQQRDALNNNSLPWTQFIADNDLRPAFDALHYFSFWVTPREIAKRFSTRFFIAAMPAKQEAEHCGGELTDSRWMSIAKALAANKAGEIDIPHPTVLTLKTLGEFDSASSMLEWAAQRSEAGVPCYLPAIISVDGQQQVVMPDSPHYPTYPAEQ